MTDLSPTRLWIMRAGFILLAMAILFFQLLPLETTPRWFAGPNLLLAFACAWCLRRPDYVPMPILAILFMLADLLLQRPPGLLALLALIGCENIKNQGRTLRDSNFLAEWLSVGVILIGIMLANRILLAVALVDLPGWGLSLSELGMTLLIYPLVVAISHWLMGVRKMAPGDMDALGQRA